ncbi:MFS transporter, partial [Sporichthya sp.]|uniref:MFS transporter n=1 Tax=Sporichthya sp. TaxID=65475 RepID=UPI0025ED6A66
MSERSNDRRPENDWGLPPVPARRVPVGAASEQPPMPGAAREVPSEAEQRHLAEQSYKRRWLGLVAIAFSQLLIVVDGTIVNVALPALSEDLQLAAADRQWVVTAYTLSFGGLLLLGGRVAGYLGLRRAMVIGLIGFAGASAVGGAAQNLETLLAARAAQGVFGALLAPAALALLSTTFTDTHERAKAFAIFGVVAGGGSAVGLIAGGMLTEYANWRWTMYINVPLAVLSVVGAYLFLDEMRGEHPGRLDLIGTVLATGGLVCVVYSFSEAERNGWTENVTLGLLGVGLSLLIMFVVSQRIVKNPLLPLRVLADRTRAGSNLAITLAALSMIGAFFFLTFYLQGVLGFAPVKTGVAFLPVTGGVIIASAVISSLMPKVAPRVLMGLGLAGSAVALILISQMTADSDYFTDLLPALMLMGVAMGAVFVPAFNAATHGVQPRDAGVAGAVVNATQQIGASLGVALLSTVGANRTTDYLAGREVDADTLIDAQVEGYARASLVAGLILAGAAVLVVLMVNVRRLVAHPGLGEVSLPGVVAEPALFAPSVPTYEEYAPVAFQPTVAASTFTEPVTTGESEFERMRERLLAPLDSPVTAYAEHFSASPDDDETIKIPAETALAAAADIASPLVVSAAFADRTPELNSIPAVFMEAGEVTNPPYGAASNGNSTQVPPPAPPMPPAPPTPPAPPM